uniref:Retrovirus-related Pol polyprotein from transposon TNT 1-94 n=1 Tax=Tanacetum cinerariifolium TaxID=118510 RepID=A0A6L2KTC0_TANCI|nr:retrovirus-related Pol polyprotein from transposon TNT 1-94 [Tanacetum cinerariifolium]
MTKKQKREYYMAVIKSNLGWRFKDFKGMTFKEIEAKFAKVWKQVEDFIPIGSKEETERLKKKGLNLEKEQVKKQKSSEEAPEIETSTEVFTTEKMKEMIQLVPVEDVYVQALQVKHSIIDWEDLNQLWALVKEYLSIRPAIKWKLYDLSRVHHVTAKHKEIFMLVENDYPLRRSLAIVMISYKLQVENYSQMAEDLIRKIYNIANTLRRLEMPLSEVCTAIEEKKKKLPVKDRTIIFVNGVKDDLLLKELNRKVSKDEGSGSSLFSSRGRSQERNNTNEKSRSMDFGDVLTEWNGTVKLGDDVVLSIKGCGIVQIKMYDGIVRKFDCWFVLDLKKNLISLGTFAKNGLKYHGEDLHQLQLVLKCLNRDVTFDKSAMLGQSRGCEIFIGIKDCGAEQKVEFNTPNRVVIEEGQQENNNTDQLEQPEQLEPQVELVEKEADNTGYGVEDSIAVRKEKRNAL